MRQLQADDETFSGACRLSVLVNENLPQSRKSFEGMLRDHKLIRIGPALMQNRDGLSSPNKFCAALAEFLPAMNRKLARFSVPGSVPAFHWVNGDTVADPDSSA